METDPFQAISCRILNICYIEWRYKEFWLHSKDKDSTLIKLNTGAKVIKQVGLTTAKASGPYHLMNRQVFKSEQSQPTGVQPP